VILGLTFFVESRRLIDGQTDKRTDGQIQDDGIYRAW